jgi:glycosyltransferase involved in cell wall biosynthesis
MRICVVIPDRGDRPEFMANCLRMMEAQTLSPVRILKVDYKPTTDKPDITPRYKQGYEIASMMRGVDLIAFIENDDAYFPNYLEYMAREWHANGRPELFGPNYTIYYHLKHKKYFKFQHVQRASMCNTFIQPNLKFTWPVDQDPYTDMWLWMQPCGLKQRVAFEPTQLTTIGMKHNIGKTGGEFHKDRLHRFINEDAGFLRNHLDDESFKFYSSIAFPD